MNSQLEEQRLKDEWDYIMSLRRQIVERHAIQNALFDGSMTPGPVPIAEMDVVVEVTPTVEKPIAEIVAVLPKTNQDIVELKAEIADLSITSAAVTHAVLSEVGVTAQAVMMNVAPEDQIFDTQVAHIVAFNGGEGTFESNRSVTFYRYNELSHSYEDTDNMCELSTLDRGGDPATVCKDVLFGTVSISSEELRFGLVIPEDPVYKFFNFPTVYGRTPQKRRCSDLSDKAHYMLGGLRETRIVALHEYARPYRVAESGVELVRPALLEYLDPRVRALFFSLSKGDRRFYLLSGGKGTPCQYYDPPPLCVERYTAAVLNLFVNPSELNDAQRDLWLHKFTYTTCDVGYIGTEACIASDASDDDMSCLHCDRQFNGASL